MPPIRPAKPAREGATFPADIRPQAPAVEIIRELIIRNGKADGRPPISPQHVVILE